MDRTEGMTAKYVGAGPEKDYHYGIPARDLSEDEVKGLDDEQWQTVCDSAAYEVVVPEPMTFRRTGTRISPPALSGEAVSVAPTEGN